jgi:rhamnosyltransferase
MTQHSPVGRVRDSNEMSGLRTALIIPTCNAARQWKELVAGIQSQTVAPHEVIVVDSSSTDGTALAAQSAGFTVIGIDREKFNHGATRQLAAQYAPDADVLIFMTQDAIPCDSNSFRNLLVAFADPAVGAAFGRQLPRREANSIEAHARLFNYPDKSSVRSWDSRQALGFKSIFFSNSFGAYRYDALMGVGGFSFDVIFGEDTLVVARLHRAGWKSIYAADALAMHSHDYSISEDFRRYFDIGVLHAREPWLLQQFGNVSGEGRRFVSSELRFLLRHRPLLIPSACGHTLAKYLAYKLGRNEARVPVGVKRRISMNKSYWLRPPASAPHVNVSYGSVKKKVAP